MAGNRRGVAVTLGTSLNGAGVQCEGGNTAVGTSSLEHHVSIDASASFSMTTQRSGTSLAEELSKEKDEGDFWELHFEKLRLVIGNMMVFDN